MTLHHVGHCPHSGDDFFEMAIVLVEVVDADYEPSAQEITEYADWLGMDLEQDQDLFWIARDGLKAPLPTAWKPCQSGDDVFYFNFETGESVWDHPCDNHYSRVYRRAKAKRDAPVRLITIIGSCEPEDLSMLTVRCLGSLNGEEMAVMTVKPDMRVRVFRSLLAQQIDASKRRLRVMLPDGSLVSEEQDRTCMSVLLGVTCCIDAEKAVANKEEHRRQKRELQERRVRKYLGRCQQVHLDDDGQVAPKGEKVPQQKCIADGMLGTLSDTLTAVAVAEAKASLSIESRKSGSFTDASLQRSSSGTPTDLPALTPSSSGTPTDLPALTSSISGGPSELPALDASELRMTASVLRKTSSSPEDSRDPELKSIFTQGGGADVISRQRPQSLRLQPIS